MKTNGYIIYGIKRDMLNANYQDEHQAILNDKLSEAFENKDNGFLSYGSNDKYHFFGIVVGQYSLDGINHPHLDIQDITPDVISEYDALIEKIDDVDILTLLRKIEPNVLLVSEEN